MRTIVSAAASIDIAYRQTIIPLLSVAKGLTGLNMEAETGLSYDLKEARNLLRDYRAALPRCENGSLLKEELAKLNLRAFAMGLALPPDSVLSERFQQVIALTSVRREQGGIFAHMDEARNVRHWVDFLCELADPSPEMLAAAPASRPHFIL